MAQKLVFDKLKTKQSELQITFDGINYESYNVASLKANGLEIPDTCDNFDNIKIKDKDNNEINEFYYLLKDFSNNFYENFKVKRIKISSNIIAIGRYAFNQCNNLISIIIPDSATSIGDYAFQNCSNLTSIAIPDSVTTIGDRAFSSCSKLTSIEIPNSVTSIGGSAFYNCSNLKSITIPNSVTSIGSQAFLNCSNLADIEIDGNNQYFTVENLVLFNKNKSILIYYFNPSSTYEIPNSVTSIGGSAFYNCSSLISITIPEGITSIETAAFFNCNNLTSIIIPDSVTYLGTAFLAYANNISIKYKGTEEQWTSLTAKNPYWNTYLSNFSIIYNYDENDETGSVDVTITVPDEP